MSAHAPKNAPEAPAARPVHALALQTLCEAVNALSVEDARSAILSAIARIGREIARAHALRGAEIFIHPTSEVSSPLPTPKNIAKQARAIENLAYVVSANTAGMTGTPIPQASAERGSKIVDPRGLVLAEAATGPSMTANAEIDAGLVRRTRRRVAMGNLLARTPSDLWAQAYAAAPAHPANTLLDRDAVRTPGRDFFRERQAKVIAALAEKGVI